MLESRHDLRPGILDQTREYPVRDGRAKDSFRSKVFSYAYFFIVAKE